MNVEWAPLIFGVVILIAGTLTAIFSPWLSASIRELQTRMFGSLGRLLGPGSNRWSMAPAGVVFGLFGIVPR